MQTFAPRVPCLPCLWLLLGFTFLIQSTSLGGLLGSLIARVPVGGLPTQLVVSPDGQFVYVVCPSYSQGEIDVIEVATKTVTASLKIDAAEGSIVISPDGKTLYAATSNKTLLQISTSPLQIVNTFPTGATPQIMAISPDGTLVCVPNDLDGTVTVLSNNSSVSTIKVDPNSIAAAFSPDGKHAYVISQVDPPGFDPSITTIDTAKSTVISHLVSSTIPYPLGNLAVSPDGSKVYCLGVIDLNFPDTPVITQAMVGVFDTATNSITSTIACQKPDKYQVSPDALALSPDGGTLYVTMLVKQRRHLPDNRVVLFDTATQTRLGRTTVGNGPDGIVITPDGKHGYVADYYGQTVSFIQY
jgi:DNA-binding beta-propeller fold protein YncE